jgi:transcriptional regulator
MYVPAPFSEENAATLAAFIRRYSFATIVSHDGSAPFATHMPVLLDGTRGPHGTLVSHMARANPQWRQFEDGREVLVIFTGPHAYVSPAWYAVQPAVPTWNYSAVHVYGRPRLVSDAERLAEMLRELIEFFEAPRADRWDGELPPEFRDRLVGGIVGLEIEITRIEGKFKLSQNRSAEDRARVAEKLAASADQTERETAALMRSMTAG